MEIQRKNKSYDKRVIVCSLSKKTKIYIRPFYNWYSMDSNHHIPGNFFDDYREVAIENLYWLTGKDCDIDDWKKHIDLLEKWMITSDEDGNFIYSSMFRNEEEKEKAFNSFYNI